MWLSLMEEGRGALQQEGTTWQSIVAIKNQLALFSIKIALNVAMVAMVAFSTTQPYGSGFQFVNKKRMCVCRGGIFSLSGGWELGQVEIMHRPLCVC